MRWAPYMITQPSKWGSEVGVTSYLEREVQRGFGRTCNVLRVAGQGKTWSWQGAQGGFEFPPASPTFSCCKLCLGSPNGSLNSQCESQVHLGAPWPSSRPPQDIIAEGSPPPALAEIPWLLVIFPARVPPAQKCCLVLQSHSTQLSESTSYLQLILEELKRARLPTSVQQTFIKQWPRARQNATAQGETSQDRCSRRRTWTTPFHWVASEKLLSYWDSVSPSVKDR